MIPLFMIAFVIYFGGGGDYGGEYENGQGTTTINQGFYYFSEMDIDRYLLIYTVTSSLQH